MSSDDSRVTPPGEAQPRSSRARSEESPSGADAFVLPEFDSLPDLAPLPDLDEVLKADPLAGFDEAVAAHADTVSLSGADAFPNETPATKASPTPSKATPASAATASSRAVPDDIPPRDDSPAPASKEAGDTSKSSKRSVAATLAALGATIGTAFSTGHVGGTTTPHVHTPRVPHGSLPSAPLTHAPLPSLPSLPMPTPSLPNLSSLKAAGYQGNAQDTHALSPAWASGATTAWTIPVSAKSADATPQFHVDGRPCTLPLMLRTAARTARPSRCQPTTCRGVHPPACGRRRVPHRAQRDCRSTRPRSSRAGTRSFSTTSSSTRLRARKLRLPGGQIFPWLWLTTSW